MTEIQAEQTAVTPPTVYQSLGYPMDRQEQSPNDTGWRGSGKEDLKFVSRETSGEND